MNIDDLVHLDPIARTLVPGMEAGLLSDALRVTQDWGLVFGNIHVEMVRRGAWPKEMDRRPVREVLDR